MKLWLDDERPAPEGWTQVWNYGQFELAVKNNLKCITHISLDHDLGPGLTGYDAACLLERLAHEQKLPEGIRIAVHSANPAGVANIMAAIIAAKRLSKGRIKDVRVHSDNPYQEWPV